jgi:hypothetical protein
MSQSYWAQCNPSPSFGRTSRHIAAQEYDKAQDNKRKGLVPSTPVDPNEEEDPELTRMKERE